MRSRMACWARTESQTPRKHSMRRLQADSCFIFKEDKLQAVLLLIKGFFILHEWLQMLQSPHGWTVQQDYTHSGKQTTGAFDLCKLPTVAKQTNKQTNMLWRIGNKELDNYWKFSVHSTYRTCSRKMEGLNHTLSIFFYIHELWIVWKTFNNSSLADEIYTILPISLHWLRVWSI